MRKVFPAFLLCFVLVFQAAAIEYSSGSIRLVMDERTGRFSLYLLGEGNQEKPQALFSAQDPRTSFLSVMIDDRSYKLGDTTTFRVRPGEDRQNPSFVFESSTMLVTQEFSFLSGTGSAGVNGIRISVTMENRSDRQVMAGARFLIDTSLGEGILGFPISTDLRTIGSEILLSGNDGDRYWIDRSRRFSLAGSIKTGSPEDPDYVHFANWNKLNDVTWKAVYQAGRNFNNPPYSMGDTAVCYYFDPRPLGRGEKRSFGFTLFGYEGNTVTPAEYLAPITAQAPGRGDAGGDAIRDLAVPEEPDNRAQDLAELRELIAILNARIESGTAGGDEIASLEFALNKLRAKYGYGSY